MTNTAQAGKAKAEPKTAQTKPEETTADKVRREAKETLDQATDAARKRVEAEANAARNDAANTVETQAGKVRRAAGSFDPDSMINQAANRLADNLSDAASAIRTKDLATVQQDVAAFARRNPLLFFGGAALLGFATARMMNASEHGRAMNDVTPGDDDYADGDFAGSRGQTGAQGKQQAWGYQK